MNQLELGEFIGGVNAHMESLDTRIAEQGKVVRADMDIMRGDISSLRELVESRLGARRNGYREKALYGGMGGACILVLEAARHFIS